MKELIPQADWCVACVVPEEEETYKGTIIVPRQQSKALAKARLVSMGPKALKKLQARPGDVIYHNKDIGHKFQENDEQYVLLAAGSVYCVVKDLETETPCVSAQNLVLRTETPCEEEKKCCGKCEKSQEE